jgi:hypothetical protein
MKSKTLYRSPLYKAAVTIKTNNNHTYTMVFNGTNKAITLPNLGNSVVYEHAIMVLRSFGIRVANFIHNENADYTLIIPMSYWNQVRELFNKAANN